MFKNQSIKSFFSNSTSANAKPPAEKEKSAEKTVEKSPAKEAPKPAPSTPGTQKRLRKASTSSEESVRVASPARKPSASRAKPAAKKLDSDSEEKENSEKSPKKTTTTKTAAKKPAKSKSKSKLAVADPDSDSSIVSDASPAKESVANSAKKRKLVLESSSDEEVSQASTKSASKAASKPAKKSEKAASEEKKPATKEASPKAEKAKKAASPKPATPKPEKTKKAVSPKPKTPKTPKAKEAVKQEDVEIEEVTEVKVVKEEAPVVKAEAKVEVKKEMKLQDKVFDEKAGLVSKSTSNFFGGKKAEKIEISSASSGQAGAKGAFMPNKEKFHPIDDACWAKGDPVPFKVLAQTLYCMEQTTKRLELLSMTCNYFRSVLALTPKDLVPSLYLLTNKVAPDYENLELGIGDTVLFKALAEATGSTLAKLKSDFQAKGDIGLVAESNRCNQKLIFTPKKLNINNVFTKLKEIAGITGNSSQQKKCDMIKGLLVSCDAVEARYLMRLLAGKMRTGLGELSILSALAHACATTPPPLSPDQEQVIDSFAKQRKKDELDEIKKKLDEAAGTLRQAYFQCPNFDRIVDAVITYGLENLSEHCKVTPGVPLKPMLAHPTKGIQEVLKRFDQMVFTCEYKYDGERAQIHIMDDGNIKIYSRNSENNTSKYPDIIEMLQEILHLKENAGKAEETPKEDEEKKERRVKSAIIDAEVVAYDSEKHVILPFQVLSTRKRKDAAQSDIKIKVCLFAFDLLFLNGKSYIEEPFRKRREALYDYFPYTESKLMFAQNMNSNDIEAIQEFLEKSVKDGCEGLMVKTLDDEAHYEISKRSRNWLKLKKDYLDGVGDTLDLVVIGGYLGTGKRTGVYGGYLLACYDSENEEYQTICKIGTGFKDEDLQNQFESLSKVRIDKPKSYYRVSDGLEQPDHWFEPEQVWEVKCADFSLSPVHTASIGLISEDRGISMRFPRYLRLRDDKKPEEATNAEQVAEMYKSQQQMINQNSDGKKDSEEEEED